MAALAAGVTVQAQAAPVTAPKPTVVLVHGAFADSSSWNGVVTILQRHGYRVIAAANPLRSVRTDADAVSAIVKSIKGPVVLVGHSYGGSVISEAAEGRPNVKALVYVAAFAPDAGETAGQVLPKGPLPVTVSKDGLAFFNRDAFLAAFAPDVPMPDRVFMADAQVPIAVATLSTPVKAAAWKTKPSWYMVSANDLVIPPDVQRTYAKRMKATTEDVGASHVSYVSHPDVVARIIEAAAKGVGN
jgi:pimeloyl-ACP methyl ester carboxylesterase